MKRPIPVATRRVMLALLGLALVSQIANAQTEPSLAPPIEDGFAADKQYQVGDIDSVDLSSGQMSGHRIVGN